MKIKLNRPRRRIVFLWGGAAMVLLGLYLTDPDGGASTALWLQRVTVMSLVIALAHWWRRAIFDYEGSDMGDLARRAREHPIGAAIIYACIMAAFIAFAFLFAGAARAQGVNAPVPAAAAQYLPVLRAEIRAHFPMHPAPELLASLIEHESACPRVSSCWKPSARLKSAREEGAGLGQITRAWRKDGTQRFDALQELVDRHPALSALTWDNVYQRPDLQLRAVVLKMRDIYMRFARVPGLEVPAVLAFADAGYNGGEGGVDADRRACRLRQGCDPARWFAHVAKTCTKSREALYGQRSACDINRHHVTDVLLVRAPRYAALSGWF